MSSSIDHVAIPSQDIARSVEWYTSKFGATILYQDASWAFLKLGGTKLAIVKPEQHPPHIAFSVTATDLQVAADAAGIPVAPHRDGTKGIYLKDPFGNAVELICYPPGETVYAKKPT